MSDKYTILETVKQCNYSNSMWDYFTNIAYEVTLSSSSSKVYKVNFKNENITLIRYVVKTTFSGKSFDIPILIYLSKNMPYEAPELYLERVQDTGVNPKNTDIDQTTNKISTPSLINWNSRMSLSSVLNEVTSSFNKNFPIYKMTKNQQNLNNSVSTSNSSFNNSMNSSINSNYNPPTNNFGTPYNYNNYNNNLNQVPQNNFSNSYNMNTNNPAPQVNYNTMGKVDGGAYSKFSNNIANRPPHQNTIYQSLFNNSNINNNPYNQSGFNFQGQNNIPNNTYNYNMNNMNNMNNSTYQVPNNFSNQNFNINNNLNSNPNIGNTSFYNQPINNSQFSGQNFSNQVNQNMSNTVNNINPGLQNVNLNIDPKKIEEEAKQTLIQEIKSRILLKLKEENEKNKQIENKLNNYRQEFNNEQEKLKNFMLSKDNKTSKIRDVIYALESETQAMQMELSKTNDRMNNLQSIYSYINIQRPELLRIIAAEATCEELLATVKKAFQKEILTFDESVRNIRILTREILKMRFYREKIMQRKRNY
jgi:hypothetical protein